MRKSIAATTVAAGLALGGLTGAYLGVPGVAAAAESTTGAAGWVRDALGGLVDDGTITQEQADAVATTLEEARPHVGERMHHVLHAGLTVVAEALDMTEDEVRDALADGKTIATIAADQGVEVDAVVDAIVTAQEEKVAERVADGDMTQEQADRLLAGAEERAAALVNGDRLGFGRGGSGHGGFGPRLGSGRWG